MQTKKHTFLFKIMWEKVRQRVLEKEWKCLSLSCAQLFVSPWNVAHQTPLSMEFSRQEHCSGLQFPSPDDLSDTGIEPGSLTLQVDSLLAYVWQKREKQSIKEIQRKTGHHQIKSSCLQKTLLRELKGKLQTGR